MLIVISLFLLCFVLSLSLSWFLTAHVRQYTLAKNLLDIPNSRSSHSVPTPRGGGIAIVIVFMLSAGLSLFLPAANIDVLLCLSFTTLAFALLGWQDDKHDLSAASRFLIQLLIAAISSAWLLWGTSLWELTIVNILIFLLTVLWVVWMANIYNFMDGIDGISAVETIILGATIACWFIAVDSMSVAFISIAVAGAAMGFLRWNWSPAKIFMGDVGSLALGGFFATLAIYGTSTLDIPFLAFLILYAVYLTDAGFTLLHRMLKKEKWWQAHRSHYYQRAVQSGFSHAQVSFAVLLINIYLALLASLLVAELISASIAMVMTIGVLSLLMFLVNSRFKRFNSN